MLSLALVTTASSFASTPSRRPSLRRPLAFERGNQPRGFHFQRGHAGASVFEAVLVAEGFDCGRVLYQRLGAEEPSGALQRVCGAVERLGVLEAPEAG